MAYYALRVMNVSNENELQKKERGILWALFLFVVSKGSAMLMFLDAMEEFYRNFLEQINHALTIEGKDVTVSHQSEIEVFMYLTYNSF